MLSVGTFRPPKSRCHVAAACHRRTRHHVPIIFSPQSVGARVSSRYRALPPSSSARDAAPEIAPAGREGGKSTQMVESRCGAVALGRTYLLPPLSSGGASMVPPWLSFHLIGRVEDWRAGLGRSLGSLLSRPFVCECPTISTMPRFQPPPRRTQHAIGIEIGCARFR